MQPSPTNPDYFWPRVARLFGEAVVRHADGAAPEHHHQLLPQAGPGLPQAYQPPAAGWGNMGMQQPQRPASAQRSRPHRLAQRLAPGRVPGVPGGERAGRGRLIHSPPRSLGGTHPVSRQQLTQSADHSLRPGVGVGEEARQAQQPAASSGCRILRCLLQVPRLAIAAVDDVGEAVSRAPPPPASAAAAVRRPAAPPGASG